MASSPLVRVSIAESLRTPPDEASITVGTQAKSATATEAVAANKVKTEKLLATIRSAGIRERDTQTQGIQLQADYRWDNETNGRGHQTLVGYIASNSVKIKTRAIEKLTSLLDVLTAAGADSIYGPSFGISDPAPLRREARLRAMARGQAEATEYPAVHKLLMTDRRPLDDRVMQDAVEAAGEDWQRLIHDMQRRGGEIDQQLQATRWDVFRLGIDGTPSYLGSGPVKLVAVGAIG